MKNFLLEDLVNANAKGFLGLASLNEEDYRKGYENLKESYLSEVRNGNYEVVGEDDLERFVDVLMTDDDIEALSNVLKASMNLGLGILEESEINKDYYKDIFVKYTHVGSYALTNKLVNVLSNKGTDTTRHNELLEGFKKFITTKDGWNYKFVDNIEVVDYLVEIKPTVAFAQFINYSIIKIFDGLGCVEDLKDLEEKIMVIYDKPFGEIFNLLGYINNEDEIKELFA